VHFVKKFFSDLRDVIKGESKTFKVLSLIEILAILFVLGGILYYKVFG